MNNKPIVVVKRAKLLGISIFYFQTNTLIRKAVNRKDISTKEFALSHAVARACNYMNLKKDCSITELFNIQFTESNCNTAS